MSSDNSIVSFIARVSISNRVSYLRSNILYIKWKYDVDIKTTNIQQCIKCVYDNSRKCTDIVICKYDTRTNCCTWSFQNNSEPV